MTSIVETAGDQLRALGSPSQQLRPRVRVATKAGIDLGILGLSVIAAYVGRFEGLPTGALAKQMVLLVVLLPFVRTLAARWFSVHRSSWRLFGLAECLVLTRAVAVVSAALVLVRVLAPVVAPGLPVVPLGVVALEGSFSLVGLVGVRVLVRMLDERSTRPTPQARAPQRALLVGAGRAGRMTVRELRARPDAGYTPVGFVDDDPARVGRLIEGVDVLGRIDQIAALAAATAADVVILTMPSAGRRSTRDVAERCRAAGLPIKTVPGLYELLSGAVGITKIRPLRIEDLLGREVVTFDDLAAEHPRRAFTGRRILVTGAGGSIGAELCRQLAALDPARLVAVDNHETHLFDIEQQLLPQLGKRLVACLADVREPDDVHEVFAEHRPHVVFHAAAYKHVPMMERHPHLAIRNNVRGTRVVAEAARDHGSERFVLVSTDKAVDPTSVMGASKRAAEMLVLGTSGGETRFSAVRFGNVLGSAGSVLHTFQRQIEAGGPITLTHPEITRFFMTIPEAVRLVLQAASIGTGGQLFMLDMGEPVRILDLARQMIRLAGLGPDDVPIEIVGLRPGEKLHEQLLSDDEQRERSAVRSVWICNRVAGHPIRNVLAWVHSLERAADTHDIDQVLLLLALGTGYPAHARGHRSEAETARRGPQREPQRAAARMRSATA